MSAAEFDAATPLEVQWRINAHYRRQDRERENVAIHAAWILQSFGANTTWEQLLGKRKRFDSF